MVRLLANAADLMKRLEAAADALKHASLMLRDHMLEDVING